MRPRHDDLAHGLLRIYVARIHDFSSERWPNDSLDARARNTRARTQPTCDFDSPNQGYQEDSYCQSGSGVQVPTRGDEPAAQGSYPPVEREPSVPMYAG